MIQAYPERLSVVAGDELVLHVGTDHAELRVALYRQGAALSLQRDFGWQRTDHIGQSAGTAGTDWRWDGYRFPIPADWPSGVYLAMLWERDADGGDEVGPDRGDTTADGAFGKAVFVVRSASPGTASRILYRVAFATYHAYNYTGGGSFYLDTPGRLTMRRPGGGAGGTITDFRGTGRGDIDPFDLDSSRQTFEHLDAKFVRWLEGEGFPVDYCADIDVHDDSELRLLRRYSLVLSVGHDEYWSRESVANVAAYVAQGGNVAFFSGNTCWWRIRYDDDRTGFASARDSGLGPDGDLWWVTANHDPNLPGDSGLTGASYRNGGGWSHEGRPAVGYTVQAPAHWVFEPGVDPDFGSGNHLVGYECDGAELTGESLDAGSPAVATYRDGTPPGFVVLAAARLPGEWAPEQRDPGSATAAVAPRAATMGIYTGPGGGTVFNAATTDWARVLSEGEPNTVKITRNVFGRLGGTTTGRMALGRHDAVVALGACAATDGDLSHAIVATRDGKVTDVSYGPMSPTGTAVVATMADIVDVAAFVSEDDGGRHVIVAQGDGTVTDLLVGPDGGVSRAGLGTLPGIVAVSGFYTPEDELRHVIVGRKDGTVTDIAYDQRHASGRRILGTFPGLGDVGSFYSADDQFRHALVLAGGEVTEVFYHPQLGQGQALVASVPDGSRLSAFCATDDRHFTRRVVVAGRDGRVHEVRFGLGTGIVRVVLANTEGVTDVAGHCSAVGHAVVALPDRVEDVSYRP